MIHMPVQDGIIEDKNDDSLFFLYYTFYGKGLLYERPHMCLYGIEDHTYVHSQEYFGICLSIRLLAHKLLEFAIFHTYRVQPHLPYICKVHNGMHFCICDHKKAIYCKDYCIQGPEYHTQ